MAYTLVIGDNLQVDLASTFGWRQFKNNIGKYTDLEQLNRFIEKGDCRDIPTLIQDLTFLLRRSDLNKDDRSIAANMVTQLTRDPYANVCFISDGLTSTEDDTDDDEWWMRDDDGKLIKLDSNGEPIIE